MDRRTTRRLASVASGAMAVCAFLAVSMAPALAQVPEVGDLIEETTKDIDDITTGIGNGVADAVEEATGDPSAGDIVRDTTGETGDLVGDTGAAVDDALDDTLGIAQPQPNPGGPNVGKGNGRGRFSTGPSNDRQLGDAGSDFGSGTGLAPVGTAPAAGFVAENTVSGTRQGVGPTILEALGGITFPLLLIGIVAAFLAIQGRIDSADPKLSIAILDPEDEMLSFQ